MDTVSDCRKCLLDIGLQKRLIATLFFEQKSTFVKNNWFSKNRNNFDNNLKRTDLKLIGEADEFEVNRIEADRIEVKQIRSEIDLKPSKSNRLDAHSPCLKIDRNSIMQLMKLSKFNFWMRRHTLSVASPERIRGRNYLPDSLITTVNCLMRFTICP